MISNQLLFNTLNEVANKLNYYINDNNNLKQNFFNLAQGQNQFVTVSAADQLKNNFISDVNRKLTELFLPGKECELYRTFLSLVTNSKPLNTFRYFIWYNNLLLHEILTKNLLHEI